MKRGVAADVYAVGSRSLEALFIIAAFRALTDGGLLVIRVPDAET